MQRKTSRLSALTLLVFLQLRDLSEVPLVGKNPLMVSGSLGGINCKQGLLPQKALINQLAA